jgi:hypothetical protein
MTIDGGRMAGSIVISGLRAFVEGFSHAKAPADRQPSVRSDGVVDPTWMVDWSTVNLRDSDTQSLNAEFFTRTSKSQEEALNKPRGLTIVEGMAGAGKTSVALGRLKFFSNFSTGENREHYDLQNAPESDFSAAGMVGFVLSRSLRRYLEDTARELELERLPIRDFQEYRIHLSNRFGLTRSFRRSEAAVPAYRTQLRWLRAVDAAMARAAGAKLEEAIAKNPDVPVSVRLAVQRFCLDMKGAEPSPTASAFYMNELAQRLVDSILRAEYRAREDAIHELSARNEFRDRFDREKDLGVTNPFFWIGILGNAVH